MNLETLLEHLNKGLPLRMGTEAFSCMSAYSEEARRITAELNGSFQAPEKYES